MKEKLKKHWKNIVIVLLLILLVWFIIIPKYNLWQQSKGYQMGYSQAIVNVMVEASNCKDIVPLTFNNKTVNIFAMECLNGK